MADPAESIVEAGYDAVYAASPASPTLWRLWRENAVGGDFPDDLSHISFVTLAELRRIMEHLGLSQGLHLVDLACGMGGPGLWIARETGALSSASTCRPSPSGRRRRVRNASDSADRLDSSKAPSPQPDSMSLP